MNILFASSIHTWGGGENWMLSAALGMRERGHAVTLAVRPGSDLAARARTAGLPVQEMDYKGDLDPRTFWSFYRLCRQERIQVVCLNMQRVLRIAGPAARLAGVPAVVPRVGSQAPLGGKISHVVAWKHVATGIIANSRATARTLVESAPWLPAEKVRVIYNGIHVERFAEAPGREAVRREFGAGPDAPVIGMVGELTTRKNHILVLRLLPALLDARPDLQVWIVGDGDQREVLTAEAKRLGVADAVRLTGFRQDIPDLIAGMDILAHPALMEGFGYVLAEAMAAGKPVVSADTSNLPEIVAEGETGYLCSPQDPELWRRRLSALLTRPESARALGEAGRQRARRDFAVPRMLDELESYFRELIG